MPNTNYQLPTNLKQLKIALVHDWLTGFAGAERVLLQLHKMFPEAPIYTSVYNSKNVPQFKNAEIRTSFIQNLPLAKTRHQLFPFLRRRAFEKFDFSGYDLVISVSGAEAKGIKAGKWKMENGKWDGTLHINYCNSPTHYYWSHYEEYLANPGLGWLNPFVRMALKTTIKSSRKWDLEAAKRPDAMIANSTAIAKRIKKYYNRDSTVIHPPVDVARFQIPDSRFHNKSRKGFIVVGRQVPYKRIDLPVAACTELGLPLKVVGTGPEHEHLRKIAGPTVEFLTNVDDTQKVNLLQQSEGFIFPNEDDFGIAPVEAMAAGCPVIAYTAGGALDTVKEGVSGIFFDKQTKESLVSALKQFDKNKFKQKEIASQANNFSAKKFEQKIVKFVDEFISSNL